MWEAPLTKIDQSFSLASGAGVGIACDENGVFVGETPLLERSHRPADFGQWAPRSVFEINHELGKQYDLPIEFSSKITGLGAVARALNRNDVVHAQIATLHLRMPDPPALAKSAQTTEQIIGLATQLRASDLPKADWDPTKHPRWPAQSPGGIGGEFAPSDSGANEMDATGSRASLTPAQITIPLPLEFPIPGETLIPGEIAPPLGINPQEVPRNPYPDRPECVEEWTDAYEYCRRLQTERKLGKGDYRGMGNSFGQCVRGQVSESCGGNEIEA